jgi:hypothetical protein
MKFSLKNKIITTLIFFLFLIIILIVSNLLTKSFYLRNVTTQEQKVFIKKTFLPWRASKEKKEKKFYLQKLTNELNFKKSLNEIRFKEKIKINLDKNLFLEKYTYLKGFETGIDNTFPGSGYLDFFNNDLVVISSRGVLGYNTQSKNNLNFKQIENNIHNFINEQQFKKHKRFSIKDLHISNNKIYVSYTEEIKKNCWNMSVLYADFSYSKINFKKLFSPKECIHSVKNNDNEFNAMQSGGRIITLDNNHIIFSTGEFRSRYLAQNIQSINGKLIKININNSNFKIISSGHRNVQGLLHDKDENFLLFTEHGPAGGDEINLLDITKNTIQNYGWPISSYGYHYSDKLDITRNEKYPFLKSHSSYGYIEPLKYFTPSIGPSEIVKIDAKSYIFSCLSCKSIFFFNLDSENKIENISRVRVEERVRDMIYKDKKLYLFLEDTASIGIIKL